MPSIIDVDKIDTLLNISIARAESRVMTAAETGDASKVTTALSHVDELAELKMHIQDVTAGSRRVPSWLLWLFPKSKTPAQEPIDSEMWKAAPGETNADWTGVFRG